MPRAKGAPPVSRSADARIPTSVERVCSSAAPSSPRAIARVALRGASDARACAQLGVHAGGPIESTMVEDDLRKLHATGWYDDVAAVEIEDTEGRALVYEVRERPILAEVEIIGAPEDVPSFEDLGARPERVDPVWVRVTEQRLLELLHDAGYRSAQVGHQVVRSGNAKLVLRIQSGSRVVLGSVRIEGLVTAREDELRKLLRSRSGEPAPTDQVERDGLVLSAALYDLGLVQCDVRTQLIENPGGATVDLVFTVVEGHVFHLGKVAVTGPRALPAERYRAILAPLKRGVTFGRSAIVDAIQAIEALHRNAGVSVHVEPITTVDASRHLVDLDLRIVAP